jgi:hypothetical protein
MTLTQAEMEARYDAERSGAAYVRDTPISPDEERALDILLKRQQADDENNIADEIDCILADMRLAATADDAPTMREKVEILFEAGRMPSGDQIFELVLEDRIAHFIWARCIDWVLWRQAHGKPVKVLGDPDRTSATIDARYDAARDFATNPANFSPSSSDRDVALACAGGIIRQWERTPEEQARIDRSNQDLSAILEAIEAHFETAPLGS